MLIARHRPLLSRFVQLAPRILACNSFSSSPNTRLADMSGAKDAILESMEGTKPDYVRLGKSGLKVSIPIFGTMSFGSKEWAPWVIEEAEALPLLKAAYDRGLTTWDTANLYSNGVCEQIIGKALKKYDIPRHKVFILTKCFFEIGENPGDKTMGHGGMISKTKDYVNQGGLSRGAIFRAIDASLKRLGTDYVDMLQIHRFDRNTPIEETMEALHDLVKMGKCHYIGASSMWATQFAQMQQCAEKHGWTKFVSMQNRYSLVYREEEREMIRYCNDTGVGIIPWAPLSEGMLARPMDSHGSTTRSKGKALPSEMHQEIVKRVQEIAEKKGWKMSHVALAWIKAKVASPIVGFSSIARLDEALELRGKDLTEEEMKYLEEPYKPQPIAGHG